MANLKIEPRIAPSMNSSNFLKQSSYVLHVSGFNVSEACFFDRASRDEDHVRGNIPRRFSLPENFPEKTLRSIPRHGPADTPARDNAYPEWTLTFLHDKCDEEASDDTLSSFVCIYKLSSPPKT